MKTPVSHVLLVGRAPSCWQQDITRRAAQLQRLQGMCAWVKPLTETHPRLREKPLWGECLADLTSASVHKGVADSQPSQQVRRRVRLPEEAARDKPVQDPLSRPFPQTQRDVSAGKPSSKTHGKTPAPGNASQPLKINRKISQNMLEQLAGHGPQNLHIFESTQPPRGQMMRMLDKPQLVIRPNGASHGDWLHRVARSAGRYLEMIGMHAAPVLDAQWSMGLNGKSAPLALLLRWFGAASINSARSEHPIKEDAGSHRASDAESNQQKSTRETVSSGNESTRAPLPVAGWKGDIESEWVSSHHIAPPVVAPSLPHLIPPQMIGESAPALAAMITRQRARQEASSTEDDLAGLAANIKRILDEEARRHGIDV